LIVFTGIVQELGRVVAVDRDAGAARMTVDAVMVQHTQLGDSVAVNGVCLTVAERDDRAVTFDVMAETLSRSALGDLSAGDDVNIELAVTPSTRLGGHLVQGHVDGVGSLAGREHTDRWDIVTVTVPSDLTRYVVDKGSICLHGVSLTVMAVDDATVTVSLIPETLRRTTFGRAPVGSPINVEVDVLAKYVEKLLHTREQAAS
jgi:riboflavin synthase